MENATKALLMAAGVLVAIILMGMLLLLFRNISGFNKNSSEIQASSEVAAFNGDFQKYIEAGEIYGADLVSLANKVIDYNKGNGKLSYINYDVELKLIVSNMANSPNSFESKYGGQGLFTQPTYTIDKSSTSNDLKNALDTYGGGSDAGLYKKLSSVSPLTQDNVKDALKRIYKNGSYDNWPISPSTPTLDDIKKYKEYDEFKTAKFKFVQSDYDRSTGQINKIEFKFEK